MRGARVFWWLRWLRLRRSDDRWLRLGFAVVVRTAQHLRGGAGAGAFYVVRRLVVRGEEVQDRDEVADEAAREDCEEA